MDESTEIDRLSRTVEAPRNTDELRGAIESLRISVSEAGISVKKGGPDLDAVREWRAAIEMHQATAQTKMDRLSVLAKDAAIRPNFITELDRLSVQVEHVEAEFYTQRDMHSAAAEELQQTKLGLNKVTTTRLAMQERTRILSWVRATMPTYIDLVKMFHNFTEELERTNTTLTSQRQSEADAANELHVVANGVKKSNARPRRCRPAYRRCKS